MRQVVSGTHRAVDGPSCPGRDKCSTERSVCNSDPTKTPAPAPQGMAGHGKAIEGPQGSSQWLAAVLCTAAGDPLTELLCKPDSLATGERPERS